MTNPSLGEFAFTPQDFAQIARLLYDETGINLAQSKSNLVYSRLAKRLRLLGLESFSEYCALVSSASNQELPNMCAALTTNVTRFFREGHHFDHLRQRLLPGLLTAARQGQRLRIWSAGCSSGEEPYSIALTILSLIPEARSFDIRILATDINPHVLALGQAGHYPLDSVTDIDPVLLKRWSEPLTVNGESRILFDDAVRGLVSFRPLNLMGDWPVRGPFQVIFCRNVVIYFDDTTQARVWNRMIPLLDQQGVLYIGHSERVSGMAARDLRIEGTTTYRKTMRAVA
jgi:chemotaxis protein methyltransferase CheR